jgi:hypothetical protein
MRCFWLLALTALVIIVETDAWSLDEALVSKSTGSDEVWLLLLKRSDSEDCSSFSRTWGYLRKSLKRINTAEIDVKSLAGTALEQHARGAVPGLLLLRSSGNDSIVSIEAVQSSSVLESLRSIRKIIANKTRKLSKNKRGFFLKKDKAAAKEAAAAKKPAATKEPPAAKKPPTAKEATKDTARAVGDVASMLNTKERGEFAERIIDSAEVWLVYFAAQAETKFTNKKMLTACLAFAADWKQLTDSLQRINTEEVSVSGSAGQVLADKFGIGRSEGPSLLLFTAQGGEPQM